MRNQNGAARGQCLSLQDSVTLSTERPAPINIADALRLKQTLQDIVFVQKRQTQGGGQCSRQRALPAAWQTGNH